MVYEAAIRKVIAIALKLLACHLTQSQRILIRMYESRDISSQLPAVNVATRCLPPALLPRYARRDSESLRWKI